MPGVFISYRREDSAAYAGRLFDILSAEFGAENTFMDVDDIKGGDNFTTVIERKLDVSDAMVAVIGEHWLSVTEPSGGRRLDNPNDFVRMEISKALQRGIRVIPVLVGGATLPHPSDLPDDLRPLCDRQAMEVRDTRFHDDAQELIEVLHRTLHGTGFISEAGQPQAADPRTLAWCSGNRRRSLAVVRAAAESTIARFACRRRRASHPGFHPDQRQQLGEHCESRRKRRRGMGGDREIRLGRHLQGVV